MTPNSHGSRPIPWLRWRGLNLQLFLLIFLPITAILLLITFGSINLHQNAMRRLVGERDERAARTAAAALNEQLNHRAAAIQGLSFRAMDQTSHQSILSSSDFLDPDFDYGIAFFSPDGQLLAASTDTQLWVSPPDELSQLLKKARAGAGKNAFFSQVLLHPSDEEFFVLVAAAATADYPIAVGAFSPVALARRTLTRAFAPNEKSAAFIVDPNHQLIFQIGDLSDSDSYVNHPGVSDALHGESGITYFEADGSEHVVTFSPILPTEWALVIEEPWESVANPLLNTTQLAPLVMVPVVLFALIALWFGARQIIQPLQDLESRYSDLAWGNYETIEEPVGGIDEINRLQQTLIHMAGKVERAQLGLRGYIGAITIGQEDERRRLARELHDETIQALIALNQRVQLAILKLNSQSDIQDALLEIQSITDQTIQDLRRIIRALRPLYLEDLGLVAALKMLVSEISENGNFFIDFNLSGREKRLSPETELALFRIAQEGLSNISRHSEAKTCHVSVLYNYEEIRLELVDDGCGFEVPESPAEFAPNKQYGLLGMQERAELIGARFQIISTPGEGTRINIILPIKPDSLPH